MFDPTDTLAYVMPVMMGVLTAKNVTATLEPRGIHDLVIQCVLFFLLVSRPLERLMRR